MAEPSSSASAVANSPTRTDSQNAARTSGSCQASENQCSVKCEMGQLSMVDWLNAYSTMSTIGMNRNASTSATQIRSATRRAFAIMAVYLLGAERPGAKQVDGHDG